MSGRLHKAPGNPDWNIRTSLRTPNQRTLKRRGTRLIQTEGTSRQSRLEPPRELPHTEPAQWTSVLTAAGNPDWSLLNPSQRTLKRRGSRADRQGFSRDARMVAEAATSPS